MLETLALLIIAVSGVAAVTRDVMAWYVALPLGYVLWTIACQILWRRRRRRAQAAEAMALATLRARGNFDDIYVDIGRDIFLATDVRGGRLWMGRITSPERSSWRLDEFSDAAIRHDKAFGVFLNRENTPPWRLMATLYLLLLPIFLVLQIASVFTGDYSPMPDLDTERVRHIRLMITRNDESTFDLRLFDEHGSTLYPKVSKARAVLAVAFRERVQAAIAKARSAG